MQQYRFRIVQIARWQIVVLTAVVLAVVIALFVVAFGVFLLVLPVFLILGILAYLFGSGRPLTPRGEADRRTIDADYRVIDEKRIERDRQ